MAARLINEASFASALLETFSIPILVCFEREPASEERLTAGERSVLAGLTAAQRRAAWLRGRAALKRLQESLGGGPDTSALKFPHPHLSLTHSDTWAVAVGSASPKLLGIGVDLQVKAAPKPDTARRFLNPAELVWLRRMEEEERPRMMHRLWTVKEATFKADPDNAGKTLRDYGLADPGYVAGKARRGERVFYYASFEVPEGFLSVAVLTAVE
ncbi:MAG: 4'-phosphopantetheinyl transferase superfamily protein [Planctomycetes bacterium]|nr:4'-phosphopantetheinyl transferase superfamily protein [Planctomycetota bacterium]